MTDDEFKAHRFAQARRLVELFEAANGRSEGTMEQMQEELKIWAASPEGQAAIAINPIQTPAQSILIDRPGLCCH
jgi:hypothetical protein